MINDKYKDARTTKSVKNSRSLLRNEKPVESSRDSLYKQKQPVHTSVAFLFNELFQDLILFFQRIWALWWDKKVSAISFVIFLHLYKKKEKILGDVNSTKEKEMESRQIRN